MLIILGISGSSCKVLKDISVLLYVIVLFLIVSALVTLGASILGCIAVCCSNVSDSVNLFSSVFLCCFFFALHLHCCFLLRFICSVYLSSQKSLLSAFIFPDLRRYLMFINILFRIINLELWLFNNQAMSWWPHMLLRLPTTNLVNQYQLSSEITPFYVLPAQVIYCFPFEKVWNAL